MDQSGLGAFAIFFPTACCAYVYYCIDQTHSESMSFTMLFIWFTCLWCPPELLNILGELKHLLIIISQVLHNAQHITSIQYTYLNEWFNVCKEHLKTKLKKTKF
jgi:hypothetical protein